MTLTELPVDHCGLITDVHYNDDNIQLMYSAMRLGVVPGIEVRKVTQTKTVAEYRSMDDGWLVALSNNITDNFIIELLEEEFLEED